MINSLKIRIPESAEFKNFLKRKSVEYIQRAKQIKASNPGSNPHFYYDSVPGYKAFIIKSLLCFGEVETKQVASEIKEEFGWLDQRLFNFAAQVIYDYCETRGKNVKMASRPDSNQK